MKKLTFIIVIALLGLSACGDKEVQQTCQCCGGFTGACWDESVVSGKDNAEARARCVAKGGNGADYNCDLK